MSHHIRRADPLQAPLAPASGFVIAAVDWSSIAVVQAGNAAYGAVVRGASWCVQYGERELPHRIAHRIAGAGVWRRAVAAGLVESAGGGYRIQLLDGASL